MVTTPTFTDGNWRIVSTANTGGDLNGDILWQNINDQSLVLWQQNGATTTAVTNLPSQAGHTVVAAGDLDGDGRSDPIMEQVGAGGDRKVLLSSTGTIQSLGVVPADWEIRASTDVNDDNKDDVIWFNTNTGFFAIWTVNGTTLTGSTSFDTGYDPTDTLLAVYGGTGDIDSFQALWFDASQFRFELVTYTDGALFENSNFMVNAGNQFVNAGDYNGDGTTDFLFRDNAGSDEGSVSVIFTGQTNAVASRFEYDSSAFAKISQVNFETGGDFDNDGTYELLRVDRATGEQMTYNVVGGTVSNNNLLGSDQSDAIDGEEGGDSIFGKGGDDLLVGDDGDDLILGGAGEDIIDGENDDDRLFGDAGEDEIATGSGYDYAQGGAGNDRVINESANSITEGGDGDDYLESSQSAIQRGGAGDDVLVSLSGNSILEGGDGNDQLFGSNSIDHLFGGDGDDYLEAGSGDDFLYGGNGDDVLVGTSFNAGASGNDTFYGGAGKDYFVLGTSSTTYYSAAGHAIVEDYFANNASLSGDHLVMQGTAATYNFTDQGSFIDITLASGGNKIAEVHTNTSVANLQETVIYLG